MLFAKDRGEFATLRVAAQKNCRIHMFAETMFVRLGEAKGKPPAKAKAAEKGEAENERRSGRFSLSALPARQPPRFNGNRSDRTAVMSACANEDLRFAACSTPC